MPRKREPQIETGCPSSMIAVVHFALPWFRLILPMETKRIRMSGPKKQIVILGGGFAGVYTARCLERMLRPEEADICLVNRENYWVYQPMLPEVISGSIGLTDVVSPIRRSEEH